MRFTNWRMIAQGNRWFDDLLDHDGPACYELGTGGPQGGSIQPHYVGETVSERIRVSTYARSGSHLRATINWHLREGWTLYYRAIACATKADAQRIQDNLLGRFEYDWNKQLNG